MSKIRVQVLDMDEIISTGTTIDDPSTDCGQVGEKFFERKSELSEKKHPPDPSASTDIETNSNSDKPWWHYVDVHFF